ncbi:MAG: adenylate kinase [Actinomycetota bacterium]|nr:adenylate kinase [Actinomycetota bacterium]
MPAADPDAPFERLVIEGVTGSGKTTAAARIAEATGIPWTSVDDLTWLPGWVAVEPEEQRRVISAICAGDRWLLDTAYGAWRDVPLARADLVIGLDYPRWLSLERLVRRTVTRLVTREPMCNGNTESLRNALSRESIIAWHFRSFSRKRARIRAGESASQGPPVLRFTSPSALEAWIATLR